MMRWLRRFFSSEDPDVKLVAGITETEAEAWRELLANSGISSLVKNMSSLSSYSGGASLPTPNQFDMWVKQSDFDRARELLAPLLETYHPARPDVRRFRRLPRRREPDS